MSIKIIKKKNTQEIISEAFLTFRLDVEHRYYQDKKNNNNRRFARVVLGGGGGYQQVYLLQGIKSGTRKVRRLNQTLAVLLDWPSQMDRQGDPNKNLSTLIDSYVELFLCRTSLVPRRSRLGETWTLL